MPKPASKTVQSKNSMTFYETIEEKNADKNQTTTPITSCKSLVSNRWSCCMVFQDIRKMGLAAIVKAFAYRLINGSQGN
jgi:hypothetical protein